MHSLKESGKVAKLAAPAFLSLVAAFYFSSAQADKYRLISRQLLDMEVTARPPSARRYEVVSEQKANGSTYTPKVLSDFVAQRIVDHADLHPRSDPLRLLDPAVGDGELLLSLLERLENVDIENVHVFGIGSSCPDKG